MFHTENFDQHTRFNMYLGHASSREHIKPTTLYVLKGFAISLFICNNQ